MRFLDYHYSRTKMNYDALYEMPIEELVKLRDAISAFRRMLEDLHKHLFGFVDITIAHPDFKTLWTNEHMIPEVLDKINGVIGKRNMKAQQEKRAQAKRDIREEEEEKTRR